MCFKGKSAFHWHFQYVMSTYLPCLVNLACERPLIAVYAGKLLPHTSWVCRYSAALICHDYQVVKTFARLTTQGWRSTDHLHKLKQHYLLTNFFSKLKAVGTSARVKTSYSMKSRFPFISMQTKFWKRKFFVRNLETKMVFISLVNHKQGGIWFSFFQFLFI